METRATTSATILRGRRLLVVRAAWAVIAALALGLFVASIPGYATDVLNLGQAAWMGAPVEAPAGLVFVLDLLGVLASIASALVCLALAAVLFWRRSNDWMVVFISSYLLLYGTVMAGPLERAEAFYPAWPSLAIDVVQPLFFTMPTIALIVLFPDGRFVPRWMRWLLVLSIPLTVAVLYSPPYGWALIGMVVLGAVYAQIYRYRHVSTSTERQQTKWVLFGILLWLLLLAVLSVPYTIELNLPPGGPLPWWSLVSSTGWWLTLTIVPLSLSIAVLRYRLYDIDLLINRALVYGALTATLVAVYFGSVAVLQGFIRLLIGSDSQLVAVASTLIIAALFNPLRRRIQGFIDRRFYRRKYDARKTLDAFSARLRDETDLDALNNELLSVVGETMQPAHASLWLRPDTPPKSEQQD
jgi:TRAP-type mannitol/chloroaromatic compound transport system permease small subunit